MKRNQLWVPTMDILYLSLNLGTCRPFLISSNTDLFFLQFSMKVTVNDVEFEVSCESRFC